MAAVTENFNNWKDWLNKKLHEKNQCTDAIAKIESSTGVQRLHLAYGTLAVMALWLMVGYGAQLLCNFIGFIYPAYASVQAIESSAKDDDTQWLIYWTVYSVFALTELVTDIFFFWVPFYWFFKCIFLVWCMAPASWNGSSFFYYKFLRPFVLKYEDKIEKTISQAKDVGGKLMDEGSRVAGEAAAAAAKNSMKDD